MMSVVKRKADANQVGEGEKHGLGKKKETLTKK